MPIQAKNGVDGSLGDANFLNRQLFIPQLRKPLLHCQGNPTLRKTSLVQNRGQIVKSQGPFHEKGIS